MMDYNLTKDFIEDVRAASDIVRVIGPHVRLRQRGRNFIGLCPFHEEKTPSFNVNRERQMFYCFGCAAGGDVFKFLMQHENMTFPEAVVDLAKAANLPVPMKTSGQKTVEALKSKLAEANDAALEWFHARLLSAESDEVRQYLEERAIDTETIADFQIGYAPDSFNALQKELAGEFSAEILIQAGLVQKSTLDQPGIDRFRKRVIIPIHSASARLVAFGGRIFGEGEPKYLNSPETPLFRKSYTLFGLQRGMRTIRKRNFAILVEGYFDAIILHRNGFDNTVAPLGTSLAEGQTKLLRRYCDKVIICMDADAAGQKAAVRSAGLLLDQQFAVNILPLPSGEDPDSFVRNNGAEAFRELLKASQPAYSYVLKETAARHDLSRAAGKRAALTELAPLLAKLSDPLVRSEAVIETSIALGVDDHIVTTELRNTRGGLRKTEASSIEAPPWLPVAERMLLLAAAHDPQQCRAAIEDLRITDALTTFTRSIIEKLLQDDFSKGPEAFLSLVDLAGSDEEKSIIASLAVREETHKPIDARECAVSIAITALQKHVRELSERISRLENRDADQADQLHSEKMELTQKIFALENR